MNQVNLFPLIPVTFQIQAIDRIHRLEQRRQVNVYRLAVEESVEKRMLKLQDKKLILTNLILNNGEAPSKSLSLRDIMVLFEYDYQDDE